MKPWGIVIIALAAVGALVSPYFSRGTKGVHFSAPLYAQQPQQIGVPQPMTILPWLHVEVSTNYGWFWQKSSGRAWVTISQKDTTRVNVGELCIRMQAHDTSQTCETNVSELTVSEKKKGIQIKKRTAIVSAWTVNPTVDTVTVRMEP